MFRSLETSTLTTTEGIMRFVQTLSDVYVIKPSTEEERESLETFLRDIKVGRSLRFHFFRQKNQFGLILTVLDSKEKIFLFGEEMADIIVLIAMNGHGTTRGNILSYLGITGEQYFAISLAFPPLRHIPRHARRRRTA